MDVRTFCLRGRRVGSVIQHRLTDSPEHQPPVSTLPYFPGSGRQRRLGHRFCKEVQASTTCLGKFAVSRPEQRIFFGDSPGLPSIDALYSLGFCLLWGLFAPCVIVRCRASLVLGYLPVVGALYSLGVCRSERALWLLELVL